MLQNRGLKTRIPVSSTIKIDLYEWLKEYSEETSIPISKLLDKSINCFKNTVAK